MLGIPLLGRRNLAFAARLGMVVVVALMCSPLPVADAALAPWATPASPLAPAFDGSTGDVSLASSLSGAGLAAWTADDGTPAVQIARRSPGGEFEAPITLSASAASEPQAAIGPSGDGVVVWTEFLDGHNVVRAALVPPAGDLGAPQTLSPTRTDSSEPAVAAGPDGAAVAAWKSRDSGDDIIQAAYRPAGAAEFGPRTEVSAAGRSSREPQVALGTRGGAIVWLRDNGGPAVAQGAGVSPTGQVQAPTGLSSSILDASSARVAADAAGNATAVWSERGLSGSSVHTAHASNGSSFEPSEIVTSDGRTPRVAVSAAGATAIAWLNDEGLRVQTTSLSGAPAASLPATPPLGVGDVLMDPEISVADDGAAAAVWTLVSSSAAFSVQASTRTRATGFGPAANLSDPRSKASNPRVSMTATGSLTAAWDELRAGRWTAQAVRTTNPPTILRAPTISGQPTLGQTLTCAPGLATDSTRIAVGWARDDGSRRDGADFRVAAADVGHAVRCEVTAINRYGEDTATSDAVRITPADVQPASHPPARIGAPRVLSRPRLSGVPRVGRTLRCRAGTFADATRRKRAWLRNGRVIPGASRSTYRLTSRDRGTRVSCRTTGVGPGGSTASTSRRALVRALK